MKKIIVLFLLLITSLGYGQCLSTTVWNGVMWSNGIPSSTTEVFIIGSYDTNIEPSFDCCNLTIGAGGSLIISIAEYVNVYNNINVDVNGQLLVMSGSQLIPISNSCISTGNVSIERRTTVMKRYDYTYWSSPTNTAIGASFLPTRWESNHTYTFNTSNFFDIEEYYLGTFLSNIPDGQDDNNDAWTNALPSDIMVKGKGYISMIKSIIPTGTYPRTESVWFTGPLNVGIITTPIVLSANVLEVNDDMNLIGNPYSAAISSPDFIDANIANISGTLFFWTHTNTLTTSYSGLEMFNFSVNDYARYTKLGGVAATFGGKIPSNVIGSCQGFFVEAENNANLTFTPSLMSNAYVNTTSVAFFRNQEVNKIWLNISTELGLFSQQLIGYSNDSSLEYNKGFDAKILIAKNPIKFYSIENGNKYDIQARGIFDINDVVKIGYETAVAETFTISLDSIQGIDNVYIKDNGVLHNLPYTFTSEVGEFNNRFEIVYDSSLSLNDNDSKLFRVVPNPTENICTIFFNDFNIVNSIDVYDVRGRGMDVKIEEYSDRFTINLELLDKGIYLVKVNDYTIKVVKN